ncbi:hypothetical protein K443DRAFT_171090 [Laccaria amethystina LaAM-08-1]|uniref:Uncharacterized protein n=1 Tax=Laccaria amethystina LaAM-08-1 TaxID=1095629 RepID=A0A0C9WP14_9AGAR|nr:hypothetical protein K443DRAFT_171090 [Laccaria amethystina LaAM-08-1]
MLSIIYQHRRPELRGKHRLQVTAELLLRVVFPCFRDSSCFFEGCSKGVGNHLEDRFLGVSRQKRPPVSCQADWCFPGSGSSNSNGHLHLGIRRCSCKDMAS